MKHTCHWPGCETQVPPRMWGCRQHWFRLPKLLRDLIWATYRPGQEIDKDPSTDYLAVSRTVQIWISRQEGAEAGSARECGRCGRSLAHSRLRGLFCPICDRR